METKNEQNIRDIFNSFVETRKRVNNIKSSLVVIETNDDMLIHVQGGAKDLAISLYELCKAVPKTRPILQVELLVLEKEEQATATDEAN